MAIEAKTDRYAWCIDRSHEVRWDIETDVIRGRTLDPTQKYLPDGLTRTGSLPFLTDAQRTLLSQVQGRTYLNMLGLVERYIGAKVLDISNDYWLGDQVALEALVRFGDEELKHQALFRRIEAQAGRHMPKGYAFRHDPNQVARLVLGSCAWAVLALTCHLELLTEAHYRESVEPDVQLSELFRDVLLYHWRESHQHAVLVELEWRREDANLTMQERDAAVEDLIALVDAVDSLVRLQAAADARYFTAVAGPFDDDRRDRIDTALLAAYRWQFVVQGVRHPGLRAVLNDLLSSGQLERLDSAIRPIIAARGSCA